MFRTFVKALISMFMSVSTFFSSLFGSIGGTPYTKGTQVDMSKFELV